MEDESENEEFYNGLEDDADVNERAGGTVFEADGGDQEAINEAISVKQEATYSNCPGTEIVPPALESLACQIECLLVNSIEQGNQKGIIFIDW